MDKRTPAQWFRRQMAWNVVLTLAAEIFVYAIVTDLSTVGFVLAGAGALGLFTAIDYCRYRRLVREWVSSNDD